MSTEMNFVVHCIEIYKSEKDLTGKKTFELFKQYGLINYLTNCYESLHTVGSQYIVDDIDEYISCRN